MQERRIVQTSAAPAAIGPYSQAVVHGGLVFCSGQICLDPRTAELIEGDVADEARRVLTNLGAVLEAAGSGFDAVLKTTVFLVDMADYATVNEVYAEFFTGDEPPARAAVAVSGLPKGVRVEIECVAAVRE